MQRRAAALTLYSLLMAFLLLVLFIQEELSRLVAIGAMLLTLGALLALLIVERKWDATHLLGLGLIILTAPLALILVEVEPTGITYVYGALLILAAFTLFIVEILSAWRSIAWFDRFLKRQEPAREEQLVEPIVPIAGEKLLAKGGSDIFHKESCTLIAQTKLAELIHFTKREEAEDLGLQPCKICKP